MTLQQSSLVAATALLTLLSIALVQGKPTVNSAKNTLDLRMPGVQPQAADTYLCFPTELTEDHVYITGFEPHANMSTSHHMMVYGCSEPGDTGAVWNCGEMAAQTEGEESGPVCREGAQIIYAWAMDAPEFKLPADVAFKVGAATDVKWLVLQVHYKDVHQFTGADAITDHSGVSLETTAEPQPKTAGVYLLGTDGELAPKAVTYMETACSVETPVTMHPFAYRAHTHIHGEVVSGYAIHNGEWREIGRVSPQLPEMFYDVSNPGMTIENGDVMAARCTMRNDGDDVIRVGATQNDEMCNFYVMYWVDGDELPTNAYCFTDGPPRWSWAQFEGIDTEQVPANASLVPGTDVAIQATEQLFDYSEEALKEIEEVLEQSLLKLLSGYDDTDYYDSYAPYDDAAAENYVDNPFYNALNPNNYKDYYQALDRSLDAYKQLQFDPRVYADDQADARRADDDVYGQYRKMAPPSREQFLQYYENME